MAELRKFDFKGNWNTLLPLLKTKKYQKLMKKAIRTFTGKKYKGGAWASYSGEHYALYSIEADDKYIEQLIKEGKLDKGWDRIEEENWDRIKDEKKLEEYEEKEEDIEEKREQLLENAPHKDWINDINAYNFHRMCFSFNPIVGYELAKQLMPNEEWFVKVTKLKKMGDCLNEGHATVTNKDETFYFDVVFTDDDETPDMIRDLMNGICNCCNKQHKYRTRKYKPKITFHSYYKQYKKPTVYTYSS
jgi:hypothetical protein